MVVPFLGYVILLGSISGTTYSIDLSNVGLGTVESSPNGSFMRLKITFIGLSIIGFSTIFFRLICPREVSKYRDREDYIISACQSTYPEEAHRKKSRIQTAFWYDKFIDGCEASRNVELTDDNLTRAARIHHEGGVPPLNREDWLDKNINSLNAIHSFEYEMMNYSLIGVRYPIFLFFSIGFILTLVPSVQIFIMVLKDVIASL
jgi:hypothetical protein